MKSDKTPCIIYAEFESLIKKIDVCVNNTQRSLTTKIGELKWKIGGYSISNLWAFDNIENSIVYIVEKNLGKSCVFL